MQSKPKPSLNIKQRFSCGVGSVLNEVFRQLYISFTIIFLMQVVELPASDAGLALLIGQLTDAFISPINGYFGDHVHIPFISKKMGRRKSWHLVGTILMAVSLPLLFNRCLLCSEYKDVSWLPLAYYGCILVVVNIAYNMLEINHLSIIPTVANTIQEGTALNAIRIVFTFLSGIYVYLVAWWFLGQDDGDDLRPESVTQFAHTTWITTGTGVIFSIIFYIGTKELKTGLPRRKIGTPLDPVDVEGPFNASQSVYSVVLENVDDEFVQMAHGSQPETSAAEGEHLGHEKGSENQGARSFEDEPECSTCRQDSSETETTDGMDKHSENTDTGDNERDEATSRNAHQQKRGMSMITEDSNKLGIFNLGYQNETVGTEIRAKAESYVPCCEVDVHVVPDHFKAQMATSTKRENSRKGSFFDQKHHACDTAIKEGDSTDAVCTPELNAFETEVATLSNTRMERKASSFEEEQVVERTGIEVDSIDLTCKPALARSSAEKRKQKTTKDWLTNPRVYKVAVIVTCSRLVQDAVYAYLPLFLTETLGFEKQSIAYFPLVLLVSAALGSTISDKLSTKIGSKWTYLLASFLVIGGSVYCYFQTHSLSQSTYAPVIVIGSGMSIMYVMALSFVTELIAEDKETSGSVFAIVIFIGRLFSGGLFISIQKFYPENGSDSNASDYVRHVFSMVPAILAFVGSLMALFFQCSSLRSTRKEYSPTEEATLQADASTASFDVVVISE